MSVPRSHPRYLSLSTRDRLVEGWNNGLVATQGLIAHGRGEAFDYLIGEKTTEEAEEATMAAAVLLINARSPVVSVNGNVGALCASDIARLQEALEIKIEVNIFHRTEKRVDALVTHLERNGVKDVLGREPDSRIPGLDHARALCTAEGIFDADVILVPLEDGDRCRALKEMGKKVITIDLNPLSRTAQTADITIVDNLTRALPRITDDVRMISVEGAPDFTDVLENYDNQSILKRTLGRIGGRFRD